MALSKGFRIFEKKQPNHSIILEHRQRTQEALLFESQAVAVLCKNFAQFLSSFCFSTYLLNSIDVFHLFPLYAHSECACVCFQRVFLSSCCFYFLIFLTHIISRRSNIDFKHLLCHLLYNECMDTCYARQPLNFRDVN